MKVKRKGKKKKQCMTNGVENDDNESTPVIYNIIFLIKGIKDIMVKNIGL